MNLNHLNYFIDLATTLNFGQTAKNLSIAQPAVSKAIKNLEEQLNTTLFLRNNKQVQLSLAGKELYQRIKAPWERLHAELQSIQEQQKIIQGTIRIGTLYELGEHKIVPLLTAFSNLHPEINLELHYTGNQELNNLLASGELDFTFGISPIDRENILSFPILKQRSFLLSARPQKTKFHPKNAQFVLYRNNDPLLESYLAMNFPKFSMSKINKRMIFNSHRAIVTMLQANKDLYAVLPEFSISVEQAISEQTLFIADNKVLNTTIYLNYWHQDFPAKRLLAFEKFIKTELKI